MREVILSPTLRPILRPVSPITLAKLFSVKQPTAKQPAELAQLVQFRIRTSSTEYLKGDNDDSITGDNKNVSNKIKEKLGYCRRKGNYCCFLLNLTKD